METKQLEFIWLENFLKKLLNNNVKIINQYNEEFLEYKMLNKRSIDFIVLFKVP